MFFLNLCDNSGPLNVFLIIKVIFEIICVVLPLIIMFRFFSAMFKSLLSGDGISGAGLQIIKNTIAALIIFLLPSVFEYIFVDLMGATDVEVIRCFNDASVERVRSLREAEKIKEQEELQDENLKKANELNRQKEIEKQKNEEKKKFNEELKKKKAEEEAKKNNNNGGTSGGTTPNQLPSADVNVFIGDSRTVGMCIAMTGDSSGCSYSNGGAKYNGSDIYIAQGSMSYAWFNSTAVPALNNIISNYSDVRFNVYSLMGVNMLLYDIDKYIPLYNSLASGNLKNHNLILVSVNPVDEAIEAKNGYSTKNSDIVTFNNKLRSGVSGSNVKYCDTYNSLLNNFSTFDGLHYSTSTYQSIYSRILACGS